MTDQHHRVQPTGLRAAALYPRLGLLPGLVALSLLAGAPPAVAQEKGIDCDCILGGPFSMPAGASGAEAPDPDGFSATHAYKVSATAGPGLYATVAVQDWHSGAQLLSNLTGSSWGFSPKERYFAIATIPAGSAFSIDVYDLGVRPVVLLGSFPQSAGGGSLAFSPLDNWIVDLQVLGSTTFHLRIVSGATRTEAFSTDVTLGTLIGPGSTLALGFSPDGGERTLLYWFADASNFFTTGLANLHARVSKQRQAPVGTSSFVPTVGACGDLVGIVEASNSGTTSTMTGTLIETFAFTQRGTPLATTVQPWISSFSTTNAGVVAVMNDLSTVRLTDNVAGGFCPGEGPPVAAFTAPPQATTGVPVQFTDGSSAPGSVIDAWIWNFGDGTGDQVLGAGGAAHAFAHAGGYTVTLTIRDQRSLFSTVTHAITILDNAAPSASFTMSPAAPQAHDLVTLTDTSTDDGGIVSRTWIVNGNQLAQAGATATVQACPGPLEVLLVVGDAAGQAAQASRIVTVPAAASVDVPVAAGADLGAAVTGACAGDRLMLAAGRYGGGLALSSVSLAGAGAGQTIIDGSAVTGRATLALAPAAGTTLTLSTLTVDGGPGGVSVRGDGDVTLDRVELSDAAVFGGLWIDQAAGAVTVRDSRIHHNTFLSGQVLDDAGGPGGGIGMVCCGTLTVERTELDHNQNAQGEGAGLGAWNATSVLVLGSAIHDNTAGVAGGALAFRGTGPVEIRLSRLVANVAPAGGAALSTGSPTTLAGSLVARNTGGGIGDGGSAARLLMRNATVADNGAFGLETAPSDGADLCNSIITGHATNLRGALSHGSANLIGASPGFADADYHLAPSSAAIDAGDDACLPASLTTDFDGDARRIDAKGGGLRVDVGWDEARTATTGGTGGGKSGGGCAQGPAAWQSLALLLGLALTLARRRRGA